LNLFRHALGMSEKFDDFLIRLHPSDEVAVAKRTVKAGTELLNGSMRVTAAKTIPAGHKIALVPVRDGAAVRRYGQIIGVAQGDIAAGEHVHSHNLICQDYTRDYTAGTDGHSRVSSGRAARSAHAITSPSFPR
jgi:altronate dehydratase